MKNLVFVIPEKWNYGFNSLFAIRLINIQIPIYQADKSTENRSIFPTAVNNKTTKATAREFYFPGCFFIHRHHQG